MLESSATFTSKLFENNGVITGGWPGCPAGANLASGDERTVRVYYDLGGGFVAMSPDVPIASSAYAMIADTLQGKRPADFVQLRDDMTFDLNQGNVENVFSSINYARLLQLLSPSAAIGFSGQRLTNLADPSGAQDATTKNYADTKLAGQTIDLANVAPGAGGGKVLTWDAAANKWVAMVQTIAGTAGGDLYGTYPNPVVANLAIGTSKLSDNAVTSAKISTAGLAPNQLVITDNVAGATLKYATCANNEILKYVSGTGWQCASAASLSAVLSVNGKSGIVVLNGADLGLGTASMRAIGVAPTNVPELDGGGKLLAGVIPNFGGDLSGAYASAIVSGLQGRTVASTTPNANEVLRWNGTLTRWEPSALIDNVGITALTGDVSASGAGSVAATLTNGVVTTPKLFATPGANRLVATDGTAGATLVPFVCNLNESLQWTASGWTCANPATAFLANNVIVDGGNARGAAISIGTSDNFALNFKTNNVAKLTILPNGNVGIGNTSPSNALTISGTVATNDSITVGGNIFMQTAGTAADPALSWNYTTGLFYPSANTFAVSTADLERMRITAAGNVGIGTTSPGRLLSVNGSINLAPATLPGSPVAGDVTIDSGAGNSLKYHNGTSWVSLAVGGTGAFLANGSVPMTGSFRSVAGTVGSPGITFAGDTDNGIFSPALDNIAIGTSGSEKLRVLANGNVGLGTSAPPAHLSINHVTGTGDAFYIATSATNVSISQFGAFLVGNSIQSFDSHIGAEAFTNYDHTYITTGWAKADLVPKNILMLPYAGGRVGIGTTSPSRTLSVAGSINLAPTALPGSPAAGDLVFDSGAANALKYHNGTSWVSLAVGATGDFLANGSVPMTGQFRSIAGTAAGPGLTFKGDTANGIFAPAANNLAISTAGLERIRIQPNGYVGIGTSTPFAKVDIFEPFNGNGAVRMNVGDPGGFSPVTPAYTMQALNSFGAGYTAIGMHLGSGPTAGRNAIVASRPSISNGALTLYNDVAGVLTPTLTTTAGFVGIGTTAPVQALDVVGSGRISGLLNIGSTGTAGRLYMNRASDGSNNVSISNFDTELQIQNAANNSYITLVTNNAGSIAEKMRISGNGNVGIGTSSPARLLQVAGAMKLTPTVNPGTPTAGDIFVDSTAANA